jgi:Tfp pilus assembly protein PilO
MTIDTYALRNNLKTTRSDRKQIIPRASAKSEEKLIEQVGLSYEFEGSYTNIAKFAAEISSLEKLIKIGDFNLAMPDSRSATKIKIKDLVFKVDIIGFKQSFESLKSSEKKVAQ